MASWVVEVYAWSTILTFFWPHAASTASDRKELKFNMSFHDSVKKHFFFQNINISDISPHIIEFKNKDNSEVLSSDFPGLRNLSSLIDLSGLCKLTGLNSL